MGNVDSATLDEELAVFVMSHEFSGSNVVIEGNISYARLCHYCRPRYGETNDSSSSDCEEDISSLDIIRQVRNRDHAKVFGSVCWKKAENLGFGGCGRES